MNVYDEGDGVELRVRLFDASKVRPAVPATVHWRLDCDTTGRQLQDWTDLIVETVTGISGLAQVYVDVDVDGQLNDIQQNGNSSEQKTVQVVADKDTPRQFSGLFTYRVRNRRGR